MDLVQVQHKFLYKPLLDSQFTGNEYIYCHNSKLKNPNQLIAFLFGLVYPWAWRALYFFYSRKLFLEFFPNHDLPPSPIRLMHPKNKIIKQRKTYWWIKKKKKKKRRRKKKKIHATLLTVQKLVSLGYVKYHHCSHQILPLAGSYACTNINTEELAHLHQ